MEKTFKAPGLAHQKAKEPECEGNRYVRAARVLAKDDTIDIQTLANRAHMSQTTAGRCKEAWDAVIAALIEVGWLPDPSKKKATPKSKPPVVEPAAKEATLPTAETVAATDTVAPPPAAETIGTATI